LLRLYNSLTYKFNIIQYRCAVFVMNCVFVRYNLAACTVEAAPDKRIDELISMRPRLRALLIGKEAGENLVNYNSDANQLQIDNPLRNWTKEDVWTFASSLCLPYNSTA